MSYPTYYFLIALLMMLGLHDAAPVYHWLGSPWHYMGLLPLAGGFAVVLYAAGLFHRSETPIRPFKESNHLITRGPYRYTRNPMCLSMVAVLLGIATVLGSITCLVFPPIFAWWITDRFIRKEEVMLTQRFGGRYIAYQKRVPRWI